MLVDHVIYYIGKDYSLINTEISESIIGWPDVGSDSRKETGTGTDSKTFRYT